MSLLASRPFAWANRAWQARYLNVARRVFSPQNAIVIRNPVSGRFWSRRRAEQCEKKLAALGYTIAHTQYPGHATNIAGDLSAKQKNAAVIVIGGDGTVQEVIQKLPLNTPLAVFPTGTVNLLASALNVPSQIDAWLTLLQRGSMRPAFGATCNGRRFTSVASAGLTGQTVKNVHPWLKKRIQEFAYGIAAFVGFFKYRNPKWQIFLDGHAVAEALQGVVLGKGQRYGGPKINFPAADVSKPDLDVCLLTGNSKWLLWKYVWGMLSGTLPRMQGVVYQKARSVRIESTPAMDVELDGDYFGVTPVQIDIDTEPRRILAPAP